MVLCERCGNAEGVQRMAHGTFKLSIWVCNRCAWIIALDPRPGRRWKFRFDYSRESSSSSSSSSPIGGEGKGREGKETYINT